MCGILVRPRLSVPLELSLNKRVCAVDPNRQCFGEVTHGKRGPAGFSDKERRGHLSEALERNNGRNTRGQFGKQRGQLGLVWSVREQTERAVRRRASLFGWRVAQGNGALKSLFFPLSSLLFGAEVTTPSSPPSSHPCSISLGAPEAQRAEDEEIALEARGK